MINSITIRNFKCLRDVQLELEPFTIFVGPNASGKSSILQAFNLVCRAFSERPGNVEAECKQGVSFNATEPLELSIAINEEHFRYRTAKQGVSFKPKGDGREIASGSSLDDWKQWKSVSIDGGHAGLPRPLLLRLEISNLVSNQSANDPTKMEPTGQGMHSALASMVLNDPDTWAKLQADLTVIIPSIRRLRFTKQPDVALLFDTTGADGLTASQVSEGTLLVLGLLTAIYSTESPSLILLDDIDRGLHPKAQKDLVAMLRGLLAARPNLQIIASTHSPYLLDCMEPSEVRFSYLGDDGSTICGSLTEHPKFQTWKDEMHSGELWSLFGEKWVAEKGAGV